MELLEISYLNMFKISRQGLCSLRRDIISFLGLPYFLGAPPWPTIIPVSPGGACSSLSYAFSFLTLDLLWCCAWSGREGPSQNIPSRQPQRANRLTHATFTPCGSRWVINATLYGAHYPQLLGESHMAEPRMNRGTAALVFCFFPCLIPLPISWISSQNKYLYEKCLISRSGFSSENWANTCETCVSALERGWE